MRERFLLLVGLFTSLIGAALSAPAAAQISGEWTFPFGETRLEVDNRANVNGLTPPFIYTTVNVDAPGAAGIISLYGNFRNLVWEGDWYHYNGRAPQGRAFEACARSHGRPGRRETLIYGTFRVTFNAAENRFEGVLTRCRAETGNPAYSQPLVGTRNNTFTASGEAPSPPQSREVPQFPFNIPIPPPVATPEQQASIDAAAGERECLAQRDGLAVSWSPDFVTHPCIYNIGDEIEIITRTNQSQRPVSLIYRAFHAFGRGSNEVRYLRIESRRGLANQGVPRSGHRYRVRLPGEICREGTWMLSLLMSDGAETAPIGLITTGDEQVPLFRRGCNPGSHTHAPEDFQDSDGGRILEPLEPRYR